MAAAAPPHHVALHSKTKTKTAHEQSSSSNLPAPAAEYAWPRRSSLTRSPDTLSPVYPDRPIRPLPKNRLRAKLSPEQASTISFPPEPAASSPLFKYPYGVVENTDGRATNGYHHGHSHASQVTHCTCGGDHGDESEEEELVYDHPSYRWSSPVADGSRVDSVQRKLLEASRSSGKAPPKPASIASSADGYESFENTSNKKKRKIPLSGGSSVHQSSLSAELANMGISNHHRGDDGQEQDGVPVYHRNTHSPVAGTGISGAGRGRYGRQSSRGERRPLGGPSHIQPALNGYASSLSAKSRGGNWKGDGTRTSTVSQLQVKNENETTDACLAGQDADHGIISAAIANANAADQQPATPQKGKANVSLLSNHSPKSATPKAQFTFTCESDSSNKMVWPGQNGAPYGTPTPHSQPQYHPQPSSAPPPSHANMQSAAANMRGGANNNLPPANPPPGQHAQPGAVPPKKTRPRRPSKEFAMAARQRRLQQEYTNYHSKPTKDSMWICEFCEYEDIWGRPPSALIRMYEIKDRQERKKAEEKRRLLEKAKMKNRKGKKNGKGKNGAAQAPPPPGSGQPYDHNLENAPPPPDPQNDEYYEDEYEDGYDPEPNDAAGGTGYGPEYGYGPPPPPPTAPDIGGQRPATNGAPPQTAA